MDWQSLRTHFPVTERWAFLDHAAVSPLPKETAAALCDYAADVSANGSTAVSGWVGRTEAARRAIAQLLNCDLGELALTRNTTEALGFVAEGFRWRDGDNVVLPAKEYPSNQYPWMNLSSRGVAVRRVTSRGSRVVIDDLRDAIDHRTRVLAISSVEYASGFRNDLDALGQLCRDRGVALCVDAIQSLGGMPLDMQQTPIDFLACGGHKWLLGPQGTGFFYVRRDWLERLRPIGVGAYSVVDAANYNKIDFTLRPDAGRWEGGTLNFGGLAALGESVRLLLEFGIDAVADRIRLLTDRLCDSVRQKGFDIFSSRLDDDWSGIVAIEKAGVDPRQLAMRAKDAGIVVAVRDGRVRISPHAYNTFEEIDQFAETL